MHPMSPRKVSQLFPANIEFHYDIFQKALTDRFPANIWIEFSSIHQKSLTDDWDSHSVKIAIRLMTLCVACPCVQLLSFS